MGKMIDQLAADEGIEIVWRIGSNNQETLNKALIQKAQVVIEFSRPEVAFANLQAVLAAGVPVISGTTGWLDRYEELCTYCTAQKGAFLYASNFSIGVNIFFALNKYLAKLMDGQAQYEIKLEEVHHTQKLDAPSGTAITLAKDILGAVERKTEWVKGASNEANEIPIISQRIDPAPGTHHIQYQSTIDTIQISHTAHSRAGFARGAIRAAKWIVGKTGVFNMQDVLEIEI